MLKILMSSLVALTFLASAKAHAADACSALFLESRFAYTDLGDVPGRLRLSIEEVREKVRERLGELPPKRRTDLPLISDIKLFAPGAERTRENIIGSASYKLKGHTLDLNFTLVSEEYRQLGLSELMLGEILAEHPEIEKVHIGNLTDTNLEIFQTAYEKMSAKEAIRQTAVYKALARYGFSKVKRVRIKEPEISDWSFGGKPYRLVTFDGETSFTLKRPKH